MHDQPQAVLCDVIGCRQTAAWKRTETLIGNFSELLCEAHYDHLCQIRPLLSSLYTAIGADQQTAQYAEPGRENGRRACRHLALIQVYADQPEKSRAHLATVHYCALEAEPPGSILVEVASVFCGPDGEAVDEKTCTVLRYEQRCRPVQLARGARTASQPRDPSAQPDPDAVQPTAGMDVRERIAAVWARSQVLMVKAKRLQRDARITSTWCGPGEAEESVSS